MCSDVKLTVVVLELGDQIRYDFGIEFMLEGFWKDVLSWVYYLEVML